MSDFDSLRHLTSLRAFEAVVRLGSIRAAAQELCVTDGAVSRQIKHLEEAAGQKLFHREHRRMAPTLVCRGFAEEISAALSRLKKADSYLNEHNRSLPLLVAASTTFLSRWLIPRQSALQNAVGHTKVVFTTFHDIPVKSSVPLHIFIGIGGKSFDPNLKYRIFMRQKLCLVIQTTKYKELRSDIKWPSKFNRLTPNSFPDVWDVWKIKAGMGNTFFTGPEVRYETMSYVLQAVEAGLGYTIAPQELVENSINAGILVKPFQTEYESEDYRLYIPPQYENFEPAQKALRWFIKEGQRM